MFNPLDYRDHLDYCEYIYNKNEELELGLTSPQEIQFLANKYFDELCARYGEVDELMENDKLLVDTFKKQSKMFKKFRPIEKKVVEEAIIETSNESLVEEEIIDINRPKSI